jgi:hypothetical protein
VKSRSIHGCEWKSGERYHTAHQRWNRCFTKNCESENRSNTRNLYVTEGCDASTQLHHPKHFLKLASNLPRRHTSILMQLRTGHLPLNHHVHQIGKLGAPTCTSCGEDDETLVHFLLRCPAHENHRHVLAQRLFRGGTRTLKLQRTTLQTQFNSTPISVHQSD